MLKKRRWGRWLAGLLTLLPLLALPAWAMAAISLGSGSGDFGPVTLGGTASSQTLTLSISGVTFTGMDTYVGGATGQDFTLGATTCHNGGYSDCSVTVNFSPLAAGRRQGALVVSYDDGSPRTFTVPLYGFANAPLAVLDNGQATTVNTTGCALNDPFQSAEDAAGNIYVTNYSGNRVCKFAPGGGSGSVVSFPGFPLSNPTGVALDARGNLYVSDYGNGRILRRLTDGTTQALTPMSGAFSYPTALTFDQQGNLYVSNYGAGNILVVSAASLDNPSGLISLSTLNTGSYTLPGSGIGQVAVDSQGYVYIPDRSNNRILRIPPGGGAGTAVLPLGGTALNTPDGLAVDALDNLYIADEGNGRVLQRDRLGQITQVHFSGATLSNLLFDLRVRTNGDLVVTDFTNDALVLINRQRSSQNLGSLAVGSTTAPRTTTFFNLGTVDLSLAIPASGSNPALVSGDFALDGSTTCPATPSGAATAATLAAGTSCTLAVTFSPTTSGARSATLIVTDNHLNTAGQTQQIALSGTGTTDAIPDAFSFTPQTGVPLGSAVTSNAITVSGINVASAISVTGGSYAINGGAYTTTAGTVNNGDTVTLRHTASGSFSTTTSTVLTLGGVQATFTSQTLAQDTTPNPFSFTPQTGVPLGSTVTSNPITVSGINAPSPISVAGGSYAINGGAYTTTAGTVNNGDTVTLRHTASGSFSTTTSTVLTIGSVQGTFTSQTLGQANVSGLPTTAAGVTASLSVTGCSAIASGAHFATPPAGLGPRFPYGLLSFVATGCSGSSVTVSVTYSESLPAGGTVFKCQGSNCTQYPATLGGNTVTYMVTDNGAGDEDAIAGQITDPSGVGYPQDPAAVPTLGAWGGLLLSLLLGGLGILGGVDVPGGRSKRGRRLRAG